MDAGLTPADAAALSRAASAGEKLAPRHLDALGRAVLLLARELWVARDRQLVLEAVLAERGVDVADAIDRFQPDGALAERLAKEREAFTARLLETLAGG